MESLREEKQGYLDELDEAIQQQDRLNESLEEGARRERYMGDTPGKNSRTGREVRARMRTDGTLRTNLVTGGGEFLASNNKWYPLEVADMSHFPVDAVKWWNETGRFYGPKSSEVRNWMLESKNYTLDHYSLNRSAGAKLSDEYLPPVIKGAA